MQPILVFEILLLVAIVAGVFVGWEHKPTGEEPSAAAERRKMPEPSA
jgi:hypothetical protein